MKRTMLQNCTFVKLILMLLVILGHSMAFWSGSWFIGEPIFMSTILSNIYKWINSYHTYTFVIVSGYIFAFKMNTGGGYDNFVAFLQNKIKRLIVPYIFVTIIWVIPITEYFFHWNLAYLLQKYILCINPSQLWFLWMLFEIFIIFWLLWKLLCSKPMLGIFMSVCFYFIGIIGDRFFPNYFCIWSTCRYMIFFNIGIRIRQKEENEATSVIYSVPSYVWIFKNLFLYGIYLFLIAQNGMLIQITRVGIEFMVHIVGSIMTFVVLQDIADHINWRKSRLINCLASYSMPMYLFHQQIIYFVIVWLNGKVNPYINACANFVIAFVGSFMISSILMKCRKTRILIGEK